MAKLTLHFEASDGMDLDAAAAALQAGLAATEGVESAKTRPQKFQSIGPAEIMSVIQVATSVVSTTTAFLTAISSLYSAWQKIKPLFPGLHPPKVEVGLEEVPIDQLTPEHVAELVTGG
jgi:hypothetical protein